MLSHNGYLQDHNGFFVLKNKPSHNSVSNYNISHLLQSIFLKKLCPQSFPRKQKPNNTHTQNHSCQTLPAAAYVCLKRCSKCSAAQIIHNKQGSLCPMCLHDQITASGVFAKAITLLHHHLCMIQYPC